MTRFAWSLVALSVAIIVAFLFCAGWFEENKKKYKLNLAAWISGFWGVAIALFLVDIILFSDKCVQMPALLFALGGACIGWLIGIWITPMGNTESTKFSKYWTAIGVGSGFTLKWAIDHILDPTHHAWFVSHWFNVTMFTVSLLATVVTVYNSRAYENSLNIRVRKEPGSTTDVDIDPLTLTTDQKITLYAEVEGVSDSLSRWEVFPATLGSIQDTGIFQAGAKEGTGKITALNLEDPTLSNFINVKIIPAAAPAPANPAPANPDTANAP